MESIKKEPAMKKMKPQSTQRCSHCSERATWRTHHISMHKYACPEHLEEIRAYEDANIDNGHMSEGEWQAYGRFGY